MPQKTTKEERLARRRLFKELKSLDFVHHYAEDAPAPGSKMYANYGYRSSPERTYKPRQFVTERHNVPVYVNVRTCHVELCVPAVENETFHVCSFDDAINVAMFAILTGKWE